MLASAWKMKIQTNCNIVPNFHDIYNISQLEAYSSLFICFETILPVSLYRNDKKILRLCKVILVTLNTLNRS